MDEESDEDTGMLELLILAYMYEPKQEGRTIITEREIFEALGYEWDDGENRSFMLSDLGENVISMADYKKKLN